MSYKVVVTDYWYPNLNPERKVFQDHDIELIDCKGTIKTEDQLIAATKDADAVIIQFCKMTKKVIENLSCCKLIVRYAIGVDVIDVQAATENKVMVANVPDYCTDEVSNQAIALMLSVTRKVNYMDRQVRNGNVKFDLAIPIKRNTQNTLGIVGYGRIGNLVAKKLKNFGFKRIIFCDPYKNSDEYADKVDFDTLLAEADVISLHAPATEETRDMFNKDVFEKMKPGVYIVNTARGTLIDEEALEWALSKKIVAGAGLDVFHSEGIEGKKRFFPFDNVVLTPHIAWYSEQAFEELQRKTAEQVIETLFNGKPSNWINPF